jgi:hypothetical protein
MKRNKKIFGIFFAIMFFFFIWQKFIQKNPSLAKDNKNLQRKVIRQTNGITHTIALEEIIGGGPPKDGIPAIDHPKFISISEAGSFIKDSEPGIALEIGEVNRFYPFQILVWHEIANDTIEGRRVLITYCPLCYSGIVFDPLVKEERVEFGTSGKLWNSNLLMYDRKTDSLWSQILGEAVVGEMAGTTLELLPSTIVRFGNWKKLHPDGQVLSRDTGAQRKYGIDPYGDYYTRPGIFFPVRKKDNRLKDKDFIWGVVIGDHAKAYWFEAVKREGKIEDIIAGHNIIVKYQEDLDTTLIYQKEKDGTLKRINPFPSFWFSWVAAHPDTELYN